MTSIEGAAGDHANSRILVSAQFLASGQGGICTVARMTAMALSRRYEVRALACQDEVDHKVRSIPVRAFSNYRVPFVLANFLESRNVTHVIYDFAGTARSHFNFLWMGQRPYSVWMHGWEVWGQRSQKYVRALARADLVLANSRYTVERAREVLPASVKVRLCCLATPDDDVPAVLGPSGGPPTVMLLGRADNLFAKGHDILIDIWPSVVAAVPGARLMFVGGGEAIDRVRRLAAASISRECIDIVGFVQDECLEQYWRRASLFAMLGFAEGFGLVYVDAMRHGLPVLASTDDGGQEVNVDGVTGFNIPRSNRRRLIEVIVSLLRDRDYARALGAAGHARWRKHYTFAAFAQRFATATSDFFE